MSANRLTSRAQWPALAACLLGFLLLALLCLVLGGCAPRTAPAGNAAAEAAAPAAGEAAPAAADASESMCDAASPSLVVGWGFDPVPVNSSKPISFEQIAKSFGATAKTSLGLPSFVTLDLSRVNTTTLNSKLNQATVGFLTAHGLPTSLSITGNLEVSFADLQLGMCEGSLTSTLRYLLLSSCNTLAHGLRRCPQPVLTADDEEEFYACPGSWVLGPDSADMGNIYDRWGPRLGKSLRMVCGATTRVTPASVQQFWDRYQTQGTSVADAFLDALSYDAYIGLCMARGGKAFTESAILADYVLTTASNPYDNKPITDVFYHLQYSLPFSDPYAPIHGVLVSQKQETDTPDSLRQLLPAPPSCAPIAPVQGDAVSDKLLIENKDLPFLYDNLKPFDNEAEALGGEEIAARENTYVSAAVAELQTDEFPFTVRQRYAQGIHLLLSTFPADPDQQTADALSVTEKGVIVRLPLFVRLDDAFMERLDQNKFRAEFEGFTGAMRDRYKGQSNADSDYLEEGDPLLPLLDGTVTVRLTSDFKPFAYSYSTPVINRSEAPEALATISPYDAFLEALRQTYGITTSIPADQVRDVISDQYGGLDQMPLRLRSWSWGYSNWHNDKIQPDALYLTYEFEFTPNAKAGYTAADYPPRRVRVNGQTDEPCS